ncbi:hypothetical protein [Amycolatopsis plumensis]|uniref:hypothetical protein n=1 Tax=Amycolatopsis plumensis TaxID=236508 RepID=UPI003610D5C5
MLRVVPATMATSPGNVRAISETARTPREQATTARIPNRARSRHAVAPPTAKHQVGKATSVAATVGDRAAAVSRWASSAPMLVTAGLRLSARTATARPVETGLSIAARETWAVVTPHHRSRPPGCWPAASGFGHGTGRAHSRHQAPIGECAFHSAEKASMRVRRARGPSTRRSTRVASVEDCDKGGRDR